MLTVVSKRRVSQIMRKSCKFNQIKVDRIKLLQLMNCIDVLGNTFSYLGNL